MAIEYTVIMSTYTQRSDFQAKRGSQQSQQEDTKIVGGGIICEKLMPAILVIFYVHIWP